MGEQLVDVTYKPGTHECKVIAGTLHDPYTGKTIAFTSEKPRAVEIDHIFALARAWDAGAAEWTLDRRIDFANDTESNLLAVDGPANQQKSDKGLDRWMPLNQAVHCEYARRYLTVAAKYDLAVTTGDVEVARASCATQ